MGREYKTCASDPRLSRRKNINRGDRNIRAWVRAVDLYVLICDKIKDVPGLPYRIQNQLMDAADSVSSNIAEGYCRRSLKEYLQFLNIALSSCGEVYSRSYACAAAGQFNPDTFEEIDELHFEVENLILKLIESLQRKQMEGKWEDSFANRGSQYDRSEGPGRQD